MDATQQQHICSIVHSVAQAVATAQLQGARSESENLESLLVACTDVNNTAQVPSRAMALTAAALSAVHETITQHLEVVELPVEWTGYFNALEVVALEWLVSSNSAAVLPVLGQLLLLHVDRTPGNLEGQCTRHVLLRSAEVPYAEAEAHVKGSPLLLQLGVVVASALHHCVADPADDTCISFMKGLAQFLPQVPGTQ